MGGSIAERVARGVSWLDSTLPGWDGRVDLSSLVMSSSDRCVLGQVFRTASTRKWADYSYLNGYEYAQVAYKYAPMSSLGFAASFSALTADVESADIAIEQEYSALKREWIRVITDRRSTQKVML